MGSASIAARATSSASLPSRGTVIRPRASNCQATAPEPAPARYPGVVVRADKPFEQSHIVLAFEGPSYRDPDYFTAQVCAGALGGGVGL